MGVIPRFALFSANMWKDILGSITAVLLPITTPRSPAGLPTILLRSSRVQRKEAAVKGTVLVLAEPSVACGTRLVSVGMAPSVNLSMLSKSSPAVPGRIRRLFRAATFF